ncbi:MAG: hypothetical protein BRD47_05310 [Bacteroidetes bacterium QS_8_68_28]|nr:MAG: hypothetical protein BRD47_05310 [Bacteroidetes bacterium QS_8_68_28]
MSTARQTDLPPLQAGDRLTRPEFERRLEAMPSNKVAKAELVDGLVYMLLSIRAESHSHPTNTLSTWLGVYAAATPGVRAYTEATLRLDLDNGVRPDALLRIEDACGGQSRVTGDDYLSGPPELVAEVAASSASYDLHAKKNVYRRHGVREYLVWQTHEEHLDWFVLEDGAYLRLEPNANGLLQSRVFPGLHLDVDALLNDDLAPVIEAARTGTQTDAHAAFTDRLQQQHDGS